MVEFGPLFPLGEFEFPPSTPYGRKHLFYDNFDNRLKLDEWKLNDYPRPWVKVEEDEHIIVYVDCGYGSLGLAKKNNPKEIILEGKYSIIMDNIVILDKDYYGTSKYIWK